MGVRTFICISLDDAIREALRQWQVQLGTECGEAFRPVALDHMHVTLSFLGDVEAERIPAISDSVGRAVADLDRFRMTVSSSGAFPNASRPRVLWAGVDEGRIAVMQLQGAVAAALQAEQGLEPERRKFHPHVTVARANRRRRIPGVEGALAETRGREWGSQWVQRVDVMRSDLRPGGPVYTIMESLPLAYGRRNC